MVVKIQSFSDVITNSSTEVYLVTGGANYVEDLINSILKLANSPYTCAELFNIKDFDNYYEITALDSSNSEKAYEIEELINKLFYADGYPNY